MTVFSSFPWQDLLKWYEIAGRHTLPWRDYSHYHGDILLYRIWLSEIFLQQTQVDRVVGYFTRVTERFPSISSLAKTTYDVFFPYYQGMGYYSRARNLLKTAQIITETHHAHFPESIDALEKLPWIWNYTARAMLAFWYGKPYLAWDTNLEKVFSRFFFGSRERRLHESEKQHIEDSFRDFIAHHPSEKQTTTVRAINNALMDFSATVDLKDPKNIDWEHYPLTTGIWYESRGSLENIQSKKSQYFPTPDASIVLIVHKDHSVYYAWTSLQKDWLLPSIPQSSDDVWAWDHQVQHYTPFILPPALHRDTRAYIQKVFRDTYGLELSVRPIHKKWLSSETGEPWIAVHAQIQTGNHNWKQYTKKEYQQWKTQFFSENNTGLQ